MMAHLEKWARIRPNMRGFSKRASDIQPTGVRKMFDMAGDDVEIVAVPANPQPEGPPAEVPAEIVPQESIKGE